MKRLRFALVAIALVAWGRVVQVLVLPNLEWSSGSVAREVPALPVLDWDSIRSPFPKAGLGVAVARSVRKGVVVPVKQAPAPVDSAPAPTLQAILWGPDPVAILVKGAASEILHKGQAFDGWVVLSIASDRVWIGKGRRKVELVDQ